MGFGIRVKFTPNVQAKEGGAMDVLGGTLDLVQFGEPASQAKRDTPKPARLIFQGAFLTEARGVSEPEFTEIASLEGELELRGAPPVAIFTIGEEPEFDYVEPEPEAGVPFRELRLAYDSAHFEGTPEDGDPITRLRLPVDEPEGTRFFELGVVLEIDGSAEAELLENHRLDVPLGPLPGPLFEWSDGLTEALPAGLTLILEGGGKRMALDWVQGQVLDGFRRFSFGRIRGKGPFTLTAKAPGVELVLLKDQVIDEAKQPIRWEHFLEELRPGPSEEGDDSIEFLEGIPELVGTFGVT